MCHWGRGKAVLALVILAGLIGVIACASMEDKRDKYMAQGKASFEQGDFVTARLHFKNALQIDPKFGDGFLWLGKTELRLKNPRGAFQAISQAAELQPDLIEAQLLLSQMYLASKKLEEAEARANVILEKEPQNSDALLILASVALAQEQPDKAREILGKIISQDPHKTAAYLMQSAIAMQQQQPEAAAAALEAGIKANPKEIALYLNRARLAESQKQFDLAEETIKKAIEVAPQDAKLQEELARLYAILGQSVKVEQALKKAIEIEPKNPKFQKELARLYAVTGQWDKAEQTLRQKMTVEPDQEVHARDLANFLNARGRFDEGEKVLMDFIRQHPQNFQAKFLLAEYYLAARKIGRGERLLQDIATSDPNGPNGLRAKGQLAALNLARNQLEASEKLAQEVLQNNPKDMTALRIQGLIGLAQKDGLKALNNFRILTQEQPQNPEFWFLLARAHLINKEPGLAKENAKKALAQKADYWEARRFLYNIYAQDKAYDELIKIIKEHLRSNEKDLASWGYLGDVYILKDNTAQARAAFKKMIDLEPKNPQGYFKLALLSLKNNQPQAAVKFLDNALTQDPNFLPGLRLLVTLHLKEKQPARAMAAVRAALIQNPRNPELHQILGELLLAQGQPEAAAAALEDALTLKPNDAPAMGLLVAAYDKAPDVKKVIEELAEKTADPKNPVFYAFALAQLYEKHQQADKAIDLYNQLLERKVAVPLVRNNLAYLLAEYQPTPENLDRAKKLATEVLDDYPDDPRLLDTMGWILCKQNDFAGAKKYLKQAVARSPKQPVPLYHLGYCLAKLGEVDQAREALQNVLTAPGDFAEKAAAKKQLQELGIADQ